MISGRLKGVIWDWNGTLLNDAGLAVDVMNNLLRKRGIPELSIERYQQVFTFPVKEYYQRIGFDFSVEAFEVPAMEFIEKYNDAVSGCSLQPNAVRVIRHFQEKKLSQYVVSAMHSETLDRCLEQYGISAFFEHVSGLDNHFAASKIENAKQMIAKLKLNPNELVLVGDTVHDFEVASELGCKSILVASGHQSKMVLQQTGTTVVDHLEQIINYLENNWEI